MKIALLLLVAATAALAAPVEQSTKEKRGLALGLGYHAPLVTHTTHYVAPAVVHHAPLYHAPLIAHTPLISHQPVSYHLPAYHTIHHLK